MNIEILDFENDFEAWSALERRKQEILDASVSDLYKLPIKLAKEAAVVLNNTLNKMNTNEEDTLLPEAIFQMFKMLKCHNWISVQAILDMDDRKSADVFWPEGDSYKKKKKDVYTKMFKTCWSTDAAAEINAIHGIDITREFTVLLGMELAAEMDRDILANMRNSAARIDTPDLNQGIKLATEKTNLDFLVMSSDNYSIIDPDYTSNFSIGISKVDNKFMGLDVYTDPLFPTNSVLLGSSLDSGYIWCPHSFQSAPVLDPVDFSARHKVHLHNIHWLRESNYVVLKLSGK